MLQASSTHFVPACEWNSFASEGHVECHETTGCDIQVSSSESCNHVEDMPNSQLHEFADALEEVGMRAVSTEWHVHLVREAEAQHQFRRDSLAGKCQLCVQCPNGRKHSSLFAIHLLPHWLRGSRGADDPPQDSPMACTGIKTAAMAIDKLSDPNPTQRCLMSACLSDWLTGEVYPDAVVFSTHPNGHLFGDKQTAMLHMPICMCMKALMKIKRPLDPRNPTEQLPLHKLSTLKLTRTDEKAPPGHLSRPCILSHSYPTDPRFPSIRVAPQPMRRRHTHYVKIQAYALRQIHARWHPLGAGLHLTRRHQTSLARDGSRT